MGFMWYCKHFLSFHLQQMQILYKFICTPRTTKRQIKQKEMVHSVLLENDILCVQIYCIQAQRKDLTSLLICLFSYLSTSLLKVSLHAEILPSRGPVQLSLNLSMQMHFLPHRYRVRQEASPWALSIVSQAHWYLGLDLAGVVLLN